MRVDLRHQDRAERELPGLGPFGQAAQIAPGCRLAFNYENAFDVFSDACASG
jgi:hypothetical protein